MPRSSVAEISNRANMRLPPSPAGTISSPKAKIPAFAGTSSTLKLDSQRNQRDHWRRVWSRFELRDPESTDPPCRAERDEGEATSGLLLSDAKSTSPPCLAKIGLDKDGAPLGFAIPVLAKPARSG